MKSETGLVSYFKRIMINNGKEECIFSGFYFSDPGDLFHSTIRMKI